MIVKFKFLLFFLIAISTAYSQVGIGTTNPNADAALDITSSNQGLLLPRIALTATNNPTPLSAHVNGMVVYNTSTSGSSTFSVSPGFYFNNGSRWVRFADNLVVESTDKTNDEWINGTGRILLGKQSNGVSQRSSGSEFVILDNGSVGIGVTNPDAKLVLNSTVSNTSGLKFTQLNAATPISSGSALGVDNSGNVITVAGAFTEVVFTASLGTGAGGTTNATLAANGFNTVPLPNVTKNLGGGTWNTSNYTYRVPISGTYLIKSSVRLVDGSISRNIFQSVHTSNIDIPDGIWQTNVYASGSDRWTMLYTRLAYFNQGDVLRLYIYSDGQTARLSDASLNITLLNRS